MFSILRPSLVYKDLDSEILPHDQDLDADEWSYNGRDVYRGSIDPNYVMDGLHVYWLYDNNLLRVGLAEHESNSPEVFKVLWIHDDPFSTLLQEEWMNTGRTLWNLVPSQAYQDCLEDEFKTVGERALQTNIVLVTPSMIQNKCTIYHCNKCNKKSFVPKDGCHQTKMVVDTTLFSFLFLDESFILYQPPSDSTWRLRLDAYEPEHSSTAEPVADQASEESHH
jgi:hypothetical protein